MIGIIILIIQEVKYMNEVKEKEQSKIINMIYEIRGKQVMIDRDLAKLYQIETRVLIQRVKRNIERFPTSFCFQMTEDEFFNWKSQIVMSNNDKIGLRRAPYVFTEQGVAMLSAIINTNVAIEVSIRIMNAFVEMKKYISSTLIEQEYINNQVLKNTEDIRLLQESFSNIKKCDGLFFEGQIYDSYSLLLDIFSMAKNEIIIIDNYIDKSLLDILRKIDKKIIIITNKYDNDDYNKYKEQYRNISLKINNKIHDRFIIIDRLKLYHCGASFKDLGKKCFAINKIDNNDWLNELLTRIKI